MKIRRRRSAPPPRSACFAPAAHLYLSPNGDVRVCCRNPIALGNVTEQSFPEIIRTARRRAMATDLAAGTYPLGCETCSYEVAVEGPAAAFPAVYDRFGPLVQAEGVDGALEWPARIEFNLSSTCNLMCIQCDGSLSSSIRLHREKLPPLPKAYGDQFFTDLEAFIPHLHEAQFAGGEPFLAPENFRVWELIERLNPQLPCTVVTNATQWNDKIERVGRTLQMGYTFSIDGMSAATYQEVRINADFDRMMGNVPRYLEMAAAKGATVEVNFCLMRQNHHEFGELLLWAESLGIKANAQVVRHPSHCSLASLPRDEQRAVVASLEQQEGAVLPHLQLNRSTWLTELARLRSWAAASEDLRGRMWTEGRSPDERSAIGLLLVAPGDTGEDAARAQLDTWGDGSGVHELTLDIETDGGQELLVATIGPSVPDLIGLPEPELVGRPLPWVSEVLASRHGGHLGSEVVHEDEHKVETELRFRQATARSVVLAERDDGGRLTGARVLVALKMPSTAVPDPA